MFNFEYTLATVASKCEYDYGAMGRVGFLYSSVKDQLAWHNLSVKLWVNVVMDIGKYVVLDDKTWKKVKKSKTTGNVDMAAALIAAFGDGKSKK